MAEDQAQADHWETGLTVDGGHPFVVMGRVRGALDDDEAGKLVAPVELALIGWLDKDGQIWTPEAGAEIPDDAAELLPVLVPASHG